MAAAEPEIEVTVAIPTFNGADYLEELLTALEAQDYPGPWETLVIDSGSTDATLEILGRHPGIRLIEIPNSEFSHGRTRDLAVRQARGRWVAFLTQDAVPADPGWLRRLVAPFADERVAIVTGRQTPRARAFPLQRYEIVGAFAALGPDDDVTLYGAGVSATDGHAAFHSDVNAAVRRDLASGPLPFRDVAYAEDQLMARDVLAAGRLKAYAGGAVVVHSNDLTRSEYGRRIFDETVGLRRIGTPISPLGRRGQLALTLRGIVADSLRIVRDPGYSAAAKIGWLLRNPAYHLRKWSSYRTASRVDLADEAAVQRASLEHSRKSSG